MVQKRSTALLALPLAGSLLLAGCSGDAKKPPGSAASTSTTPPSSSTTAPAPTTSTPPRTTTEAAPTIPPAAKQHTKAGAEAFVRLYYDEVNRAWTTPTEGRLAAFGAPECMSCAALLKTATDLVAKKQRYSGDPATLTSVSAVPQANRDKYKVYFSMIQEKRDVLDESGGIVATDPRQAFKFAAELAWTRSEWQIRAIRVSA